MIKRLFVLSAIAVSFSSNAALALDLTVSITGLASNDGDVHVALYDKAEGFPTSDGMLVEIEVPIANRTARPSAI